MRLKFISALIVVVILVFGAVIYFKPAPANLAAASASIETAAPVSLPVTTVMKHNDTLPVFITPAPATNSLTPEQKQAYIESETSRLQDLSTKDDTDSLAAIVNDLTNSEKEIRVAAIEATKQFGSSNAIPALKAAAANAPDTDEQIAMLQAAEFLSLPTLADREPQTPEQLLSAQQDSADADARRDQAKQIIGHTPPSHNVPPASSSNDPPAVGN